MHFLMPPVKSIRSVFIFKDFLPHLDVLSSSPIHPVFYDNFPGIRPCVASLPSCLPRPSRVVHKENNDNSNGCCCLDYTLLWKLLIDCYW